MALNLGGALALWAAAAHADSPPPTVDPSPASGPAPTTSANTSPATPAEAPAAAAAAPTPWPAAPTGVVPRAWLVVDTQEGWQVNDERGQALTPLEFAQGVVDHDTVAAIGATTQRGRRHRTWLHATAGTLALGSLGTLVVGLPQAVPGRREDFVYTALFLGSTATMVEVAAPVAYRRWADDARDFDRYYTPDEAEAWIERRWPPPPPVAPPADHATEPAVPSAGVGP